MRQARRQEWRRTARGALVCLALVAAGVWTSWVVPSAASARQMSPATDPWQSIVSTNFAKPPSSPAFVALIRYILPPGTFIESGATVGPRVIYVESGELSIRSGAANQGFLRAADAPASAAPATGGVIDALLHTGAHYLPALSDQSFAFANDDTRAATFLDAVMTPSAPVGLRPTTTADGVVIDPLVVADGVTVPSTFFEMKLARLEIATGDVLPLPETTGPRLFVIESGTLKIASRAGAITVSASAGLTPGSQAGSPESVAPGDVAVLRARGSLVVEKGGDGEVTNYGRGSLVLLGLVIQSIT